MASTYLDEFVVNFDLNHLSTEENVQPSNQKYEKLRKSVSWLKSRIISTDFAIQKFQAKKEDLEVSVKAHSVTREELKQVCINYKDASEKCIILEKENKTLIANEDKLKERIIGVENKYDALISHANQLQMLVKQLEHEKDVLTVEKELNKINHKDSTQITELQHDKNEMLKDFIALKDVILGKKKANKRHLNILKKYVKDEKYKEPKILCSSEESGDDIDNYSSLNVLKKLEEVHNGTNEEFISSVEQNFNDNCSDGQLSVDTGRGSSRANSHDKYLSSPDYVLTLATEIKSPTDVIHHVHAANSPINVCSTRSIATSPVIFDDPPPLFEDHYDYNDCVDSTEYIDDMPLSQEIELLVEQEKLADCASPEPDMSKFIDTNIKNCKYIIIKETDIMPSNKSLFEPIDTYETGNCNQDTIIKEQIPNCKCNQSDILMVNHRKTLTDACTSPPLTSYELRKLVDIGINTDDYYDSINIRKSAADVGTNTIIELNNENQHSINSEKNSTNNIAILENKLINTSTSTNLIPMNKHEVSDIKSSEHNKKPHGESISPKLRENKKNRAEKIRNQEKVCLESNSSKNLHFASSNDTEVQNILNVMKMHHDLISPISRTPCDSEYLKLIPEMNYKLAKIWSTIENIYKMPNPLRSNERMSQNISENNNSEGISETEISDSQINSRQQKFGIGKSLHEIVEDDLIDSSTHYAETSSMSVDINCSEWPMPINTNSDLIKSNTCKSGLFDNKLLVFNETNPKILITEEIESKPQQPQTANSFENICKDNMNNTNNTDHTLSMAEDDKEEDSQQPKYYESNDDCDIDTDNNTDTGNISETRTAQTIIIYGTKTKKRSKLDKLRDKLTPSCKIKKVKSPVKKPAAKTSNVKPKNTVISSSLKQKLAYENAVKVMAELRSKQELQDKKKLMKPITEDTNSRRRSNKIQSKPAETGVLNILSTRSSRRLSKKEDTSVNTNAERNIRDIEKSPIDRKLRKRPADTELDMLRSSSKRILRSSNVLPAISEKDLSEFQKDNVTEQLYYDFENESERKASVKNVSDPNNSLSKSSKSMKDNVEGYSNVDNNHENSQNKNTEAVDSDIMFEKSVKRTKPVIELSECLADNANVVSIIPGNVGYLEINKNINKSAKSDTDMLDDKNDVQHLEKHNDEMVVNKVMESSKTDNPVKQGIDITKPALVKASENLVESKDSESINGNKYCNNVQVDKESEQTSPNRKQNSTTSVEDKLREKANVGTKNPIVQLIPLKNDATAHKKDIISYDDLELYTDDNKVIDNKSNTPPSDNQRRKENILYTALDRYGVISVKYVAKKVPDAITLKISQRIEESITKIIASPKAEQKHKMDDLVNHIQSFKIKQILAGLMKYLKDPTRKNELFNKIVNGPAPPMTKSEVILLYVVESLNGSLPSGFITRLWNNMEHALFQLNHAPEFDVIESVSHFYAVLCRYFRNKSRLRCFMLDAMYCLQFKAVPLIRQCLDVCPGVLPNAHEHMAKTSLVTCLVYLLHFYKCEDKFNRAQDIRNILNRKYHYRFSEWNETMILEIFRKAIMDLRGTHNDKKMLRVALIILCKRHGAKWCQLNIIQNILLPIIEKKEVPDRIKQFCVLMLGPLLKPFPADRKAQCEIVINQLLQMLKQNASHEMKEAIYSSLIFMNKHDQERVVQALLSWTPEKVSPEFEEILNDYVMDKPLGVWKKLVTRKPSQCT